jgi:hypothetical protein
MWFTTWQLAACCEEERSDMEDQRFDTLVRAMQRPGTRRRALAALFAGLGITRGVVLDANAARGKSRGKGKAKRHRANAKGRRGQASRSQGGVEKEGGGQEKVTICHKPGTPAEKTLRVAAPAVDAHLAHGDTVGACAAPCDVSACPPPTAPCREAFCTSEGACGERDAGDGTPCENTDLCTVNDVCIGGVCTDGPRRFCQQPFAQCRVAFCNPATGACEERNQDPFTPCDDGDPCTERDHCDVDGVCVGFPVQCFGERICCPTGPFRGQCKGGPGDECFGNSGCCNENCIPFANICNPF